MVAGIFFRSAVMGCQVTGPTGACSPLNPNDVMLNALKSNLTCDYVRRG